MEKLSYFIFFFFFFFGTIAHIDLSSVFFLHLLSPINSTSFSIQSNQLNFCLSALLPPSVFPRNTILNF